MARRSRKPRQSRSQKFEFQALEDRRLLAGDLVGIHQVGGSFPGGSNLVANGDFESVVAGADNFYAQNEVAGWQAKGVNTELNIFHYSEDYGNVIDLDSTTAEFDRLFQNVATESNTEYLLTFDFRNHPAPHPGATPRTYDFEVWWNGSRVAVYTGTDVWQTGTLRVTSGAGSSTELLFCEVPEDGAPAGDGMGALLDNIRVFKANEVTLENAGFEIAHSASVFNRSYEVPGWGAMGAAVNQRLLKIVPNGDVVATEGQRYLNLDVTENTRDIVFRDLATDAGVSYFLSFDMRVDGSGQTDNDQLRVRWNQAWAGTFEGDSDWQTYGLMLQADSNQTRLTFLEPGNGDGSGPLIDNVRLFKVVENDISLSFGPVVAGGQPLDYYPGAGAQNVGGSIELTHPSNDHISSATITLGGVVDNSSEILAVVESVIPRDTNGNPKITVFGYRPETRQLQLVGSATAAEYQRVLRTLAYHNTAPTPSISTRTIQISVTDNQLPAANSTVETTANLEIETSQSAIDDFILAKFVADNNLDAQPVQNGLLVVIDNPGTGLNPTVNSTVRVKYNGKFIELNNQNKLVEGDSFDFSSDAGISFPLTNVILGWQLGIPQFKVGGSGKLLIPSRLAYGTTGTGGIPANSVLVFDVELLQVI